MAELKGFKSREETDPLREARLVRRYGIQPKDMKRALLGLAVGLAVWGFFYSLVCVTEFWESDLPQSGLLLYLLFVPADIFPVLLGAGVAGYIDRRHGLALGGIIAVVRGISWVVPAVWLDPWVLCDFSPWFVMWYVAPAALFGYLGQRLARSRRRRISPSD